MILTFCRNISLMRFFGCIKPTNHFLHSVSAYSRSPFLTAFHFGYAKKATCFISSVWSFLVLYVFGPCDISKVCKTIVSRVSVNVINIIQSVVSGHIQPSQSAGPVPFLSNADNNIAFWFHVPGNSTRNNFFASLYSPSKNASLRVVIQNCKQLSVGDFSHSSV